jgi:hypothetical protein
MSLFRPLVFLGLLASGPALAADGKGYSPLSCYPSGGTVSVSSGRLMNSASSSMSLTCPVINDSVASSFDFTDSKVWFLDQNAAASVTCTLYSRYQSSSSVSGSWSTGTYPSTAGSSSTFTSTTPTALSFSGTGPVTDVRTTASWAYFSCTLPAVDSSGNQSGLVALYTDEN